MDDSTAETGTYDDFCRAYAQENETGLFNAWYERPEMLRLAGEVEGLRVLDAGCGHGPLSAVLRDRGAEVSGFDISPGMIALARDHMGEDADLRVADLAAPLPYADGSFDLVVCSLALHYVEDWSATLAEFRRVLVAGGRLVVSVLHPFVYAATYRDRDYFALTRCSEDYRFGDHEVVLTYWHRPLQDILNAFSQAGLVVSATSEPAVADDTPRDLLPDGRRRFISFLFFELTSP